MEKELFKALKYEKGQNLKGVKNMKKLSVIFLLLIIFVLPLNSCKEKGENSEIIPEETSRPEEIKSKDNAEVAKELVNLLAEGKYEDAVKEFDINMEKALPPAKLKEAWETVIKESGEFKEQVGTRSEKMDRYEAVFVTCKFENTTIDAKVVFDQNKKIAGLFFVPSVSPDVATELKDIAHEFFDLLIKEDFGDTVKYFDETVKKELPPEKFKEVWKALLTQAGPFKQKISERTEKKAGYDIVYLTCEFEKNTFDIQLTFNDKKEIAGIFFLPAQTSLYEPPSYADPEKFTEEEITVGSKDWPLPGTLTLPAGDGPFPVVVLVHGSGPNDRDETIGPNKPFKDLAWGLASRGIAILRYEKRTKEHGLKMVAEKKAITVKEETLDDALASVAILRDIDKIDKNRIFVLGHSLGGMLIPWIGEGDSEIAGFIIMAGAARPLEDLILEQTEYIFSLDGGISETEEKELKKIREGVAKIKDPALSPDTPGEELPLGVPAAYWLDLRDYKPAEVMKTLPHPALIIQGERDYQVTMEDFGIWKKNLEGRENVEFKSYPDLNHLFIQGEGKSVPEEYMVPGHVAEYVIEDIAGWVEKVGK